MGQLNTADIQPWVLKRILSFFNRAKTPSDITEAVLDNPNVGEEKLGYGIGETVSQRILEQKKKLRPPFFREVSQLNGIEGLGQDKFMDLVYSFRLTAAEQFVKNLFNGLIMDNWKVEHHSRVIEDLEEFRSKTRNPELLTAEVASMLNELAAKKFGTSPLAELAGQLLNGTYVDLYDGEDIGRYAWAIWWYRFDADNWFSFDRIMQVIQSYLGEYWNADDGIQLALFKGFEGGRIWGSNATDLPVTIAPAEQSITIWRVQLND
ncbi:MAG: hypothetical protein AAF587_03010 [Bacteroidota bacterium]